MGEGGIDFGDFFSFPRLELGLTLGIFFFFDNAIFLENFFQTLYQTWKSPCHIPEHIFISSHTKHPFTSRASKTSSVLYKL